MKRENEKCKQKHRPYSRKATGKEYRREGSVAGITLIALIITIIVMLILVAVTITILVNSDLIGATKTAAEKWQEKSDKEKTIGSKIVIDGVEYDSIEDYVNNRPSTNTNSDTDSDINITLSLIHTDVPVTADGTKVGSVVDGVPIPVGFVASSATGENTKEGGLVIYAGTDPVNDSNVTTAQTERDQFVWVPVVQNQRIKIEVTSKNDIDGIEIKAPNYFPDITTDKNGNTLNPSGKNYEAEITPTLNGEYFVTVTSGDDSATERIIIHTLYGQDFWYDYDEAYNEVHSPEWLEWFTEEYAISHGYSSLQEQLDDCYEIPGITIEEALKIDLYDQWDYSDFSDSDIQNRVESVNKYGGFYIARYEAGIEGTTPRTDSTSNTITYDAVSRKNKLPYNYITQPNAIIKSNSMYNLASVTSSLVNSAAWDRTLNWLVETNAKNSSQGVTFAEMHDNSSTWGNYWDSTFIFSGYYSTNLGSSFTNTNTTKPANSGWLLGTGVTDHTKRNNIFDLAGNLLEWTTEAESSDYVNGRGGECVVDSDYPSRHRNTYGRDWNDSSLGFRTTLYINL